MDDGTMMRLTGLFTNITPTRIVPKERFGADLTCGKTTETTDFMAKGERTVLRTEIIDSTATARDGALNSEKGEGMSQIYDRMQALI